MGPDQALRDFIGRLRKLPALAAAVAREAAPAVQEAAREQAGSGLAPDGRTWVPTKDGGRPLENAATAITAKATGALVELIIAGRHVYHHYGTGRIPARQIIPNVGDGVPRYLAKAVEASARRVFLRHMGVG